MTAPARLTLRHYLFLALTALVLFLPGRASLPPLDRDESRYMQATTQMLESGNFIDVRFQDQPRYLQPAGIYWLESASVAAFSSPQARAAWAYRMPSLIGGITAVLLTAWVGQTLFGAAAGLGAGLLLAASVLLGVEARMATIDGTLLAAIMLAQAALLRIFLDGERGSPLRRWPAALFWAALGIGLMLKGPVILLVSLGTVFGLAVSGPRAWLRRLCPAWGIPLMLAIVLPWCIAIWFASHGTFFSQSVGHNFLGKVASGQQAHGLPPGYYLVVFLLSFWPGSLAVVLALPFVWANQRTPAVRFLLAWVLPTWIVFEIVATKLPHYVLPTYPALASLAAAAALAPGAWRSGRVWRWVARVYGALWLVIGLGLAAAGPVLLWRFEHTLSPWPMLAGALVAGLAVAALCFVGQRRPGRALAFACAASLAVAVDAYGLVLPNLSTIWLSPRIAAAVAEVKPCPDSVLAASSFSEPSLVFLVGGRRTKLVQPPDAAALLRADPTCGLALVDKRDAPAFLAGLAAAHLEPQRLKEITGINYSTGKHLDLTLYGARTEASAK